MTKPRQIFVWENRQNQFSHASLGFQYLTEVEGSSEPRARYLKVEIAHTGLEGDVYLRYTGVLRKPGKVLDLTAYTKHPKFVLNASIQQVKMACERAFDMFGDYNCFRNNCKSFVDKVVEKLKANYQEDIESVPSFIGRLSGLGNKNQAYWLEAQAAETAHVEEKSLYHIGLDPETPRSEIRNSPKPTWFRGSRRRRLLTRKIRWPLPSVAFFGVSGRRCWCIR